MIRKASVGSCCGFFTIFTLVLVNYSCNVTTSPDAGAPGARFNVESTDDGCGTVTINGNQTVSAGTANEYDVQVSGLCTEPSCQWSITSGPCTIQGSSTGLSVEVLANSPGTCELRHALACTSCAGARTVSTLQVEVTDPTPSCDIKAKPPCPDSAGNAACVGDAGPTATYHWVVTGGTITAGQGTTCITYTTPASGTVTIQLTVTINGCSPCQSDRVFEIDAAPTCALIPSSQPSTQNGTIIGGVPPFICAGTIDQAGWVVDGCAVDNAGNGPGFTLTYHPTTGTCDAAQPPQITGYIQDSRDCRTTCTQAVPCP